MFKKIFKKIASAFDSLFGGDAPSAPAVVIPPAEIPAVPAPTRREDTGAKIVVGKDASKNKRVSGRKSGTGSTSSRGDALGSLGRGGLSI